MKYPHLDAPGDTPPISGLDGGAPEFAGAPSGGQKLRAARRLIRCAAWVPVLIGCQDVPTGGGLTAARQALPNEVEVSWDERHQTIDGFGASSAWELAQVSDQEADFYFSPESGIGLSFLRVRVDPTGITAELPTAVKAVSRGVRVWAAPWSPPAEWKSNGTVAYGGTLLPEHYADWAERLARFVTWIEGRGVPLYAISAQNEPGWVASWETTDWTAHDLLVFVRDHLGPALAGTGSSAKLIVPESQDWRRLTEFADPILNDPVARGFVGIVATHAYGYSPFDYVLARTHQKPLWQSEYSDSGAVDSGMDCALRIARMMHFDLTVANVAAWHYWWLQSDSESNAALVMGTTRTKRAYVLGNFSRFVRPGFVRIGATQNTASGVLVTAYRGQERLVIVVVNEGVERVTQTFRITGVSTASVTPWITSASLDLVRDVEVAVADGAFSFELPARSVTTFVASVPPAGQGGGSAGAGAAGVAGGDSGGAAVVGGAGASDSSSGAPARSGGFGGTSAATAGSAGDLGSAGEPWGGGDPASSDSFDLRPVCECQLDSRSPPGAWFAWSALLATLACRRRRVCRR